MELKCDECGEREAEWRIARHVLISNLSTDAIYEHPRDAYEEDLMTDHLCTECAKDSGYIG